MVKTTVQVETIIVGRSVASEKYVIRSDGIYRVKRESRQHGRRPEKMLAFPATKGTKWTVEIEDPDNQAVSIEYEISEVKARSNCPGGPVRSRGGRRN